MLSPSPPLQPLLLSLFVGKLSPWLGDAGETEIPAEAAIYAFYEAAPRGLLSRGLTRPTFLGLRAVKLYIGTLSTRIPTACSNFAVPILCAVFSAQYWIMTYHHGQGKASLCDTSIRGAHLEVPLPCSCQSGHPCNLGVAAGESTVSGCKGGPPASKVKGGAGDAPVGAVPAGVAAPGVRGAPAGAPRTVGAETGTTRSC